MREERGPRVLQAIHSSGNRLARENERRRFNRRTSIPALRVEGRTTRVFAREPGQEATSLTSESRQKWRVRRRSAGVHRRRSTEGCRRP